jgi:heat shock protein HtpX
MSNQIRTTILLAVMTAFLVWIGGAIGGRGGMMAALVLAAGMNFFSYWYSDRIVLAMYRAEAVTPEQAPELYDMVRELAAKAGLPMPRIFIIPEEAPNAFATGRNPDHAVVAVTEGLLRLMRREEIMGVLAHELGHVRNRDILIGSIAATMAGAVMMLANLARWSAIFGGFRDDEEGGGLGGIGLIVMSTLAPVAALLIQMAISRSREYLADETAARLAGSPEGLSRALEKLGAYAGRLPMHARPETAHMFIVNPLSGRRLMNLFSTHPPLEERIARLRGIRPGTGSGGRRPREVEYDNIWDRLSG